MDKEFIKAAILASIFSGYALGLGTALIVVTIVLELG